MLKKCQGWTICIYLYLLVKIGVADLQMAVSDLKLLKPSKVLGGDNASTHTHHYPYIILQGFSWPWGYPQNGRFKMENPIKWMITRGTLISGNHRICTNYSNLRKCTKCFWSATSLSSHIFCSSFQNIYIHLRFKPACSFPNPFGSSKRRLNVFLRSNPWVWWCTGSCESRDL